jgi:hypothetical protein
MTRQTPLAPDAPAPEAMLGSDVAQMYDLLTCNLQAWSAYWTAWFGARSLDDVLRANAALAAESFSLAGLAAARRQSFHGVVAPTLNEA